MAAEAEQVGFQTAAGSVHDIHLIIENGQQILANCREVNESTPIPVHCDLAVSFGDLTPETFERIEEDYQITKPSRHLDPVQWEISGFQTEAGYVHDIRHVLEEGVKTLDAGDISDKPACPVQCGLAVTARNLNKETYGNLHRSLQVKIAASVRGLSTVELLSYEEAMASFMQNPLLKPVENGSINRSDKITKIDTDWLVSDKGPTESAAQEVKLWFEELITDKVVLESLNLNTDFFGKVVTFAAKVLLHMYEETGEDYNECDVVDIAVLQFPNAKHPYLFLYHVVITAWRDVSQEGVKGLTGVFHCTKFMPRDGIIAKLREATIEKAIAEGGNLFTK